MRSRAVWSCGAAERGIRVVHRLPPDLPDVQGDRDGLVQVFQNLLDNAVKYARPHSEVTVTGSLAGAAPALGAPTQVRVAVADQARASPPSTCRGSPIGFIASIRHARANSAVPGSVSRSSSIS